MRDIKWLRYWQLWVYLLTCAAGLGITGQIAREAKAKSADIEREGTPLARQSALAIIELKTRVDRLESELGSVKVSLGRIEEKASSTKETVDRIYNILETGKRVVK